MDIITQCVHIEIQYTCTHSHATTTLIPASPTNVATASACGGCKAASLQNRKKDYFCKVARTFRGEKNFQLRVGREEDMKTHQLLEGPGGISR